jgi:predicted nucleotidyltransferase
MRSLNLRVHRWPDRDAVERALRQWVETELSRHPDLVRVGYFGSYARGNWSVGSDVDLLAVVRNSPQPFHERAIDWDLLKLPVPADILVYTEDEWRALEEAQGRFARTIAREAIWLWRVS